MLDFLRNCSFKANTIQKYKLCLLFINLIKKSNKNCHKVSPANELPPGQSSCCSRLLTWPPHSPAVTRGNMRASALADHPPSLLIFLQVCAWWVSFQIFVRSATLPSSSSRSSYAPLISSTSSDSTPVITISPWRSGLQGKSKIWKI